jgi:hypothetical protein
VRLAVLVALMLSAVQSACGQAAQNPGVGSASPVQAPAAQPAPPSPKPSVSPASATSPESRAAVEAALKDAAAHLGVDVGDVRVDRVEARDWPDSSLGCPRPGLMYSQVVTPGFFIVLTAGGATPKELDYHSDERGRVVLCQER